MTETLVGRQEQNQIPCLLRNVLLEVQQHEEPVKVLGRAERLAREAVGHRGLDDRRRAVGDRDAGGVGDATLGQSVVVDVQLLALEDEPQPLERDVGLLADLGAEGADRVVRMRLDRVLFAFGQCRLNLDRRAANDRAMALKRGSTRVELIDESLHTARIKARRRMSIEFHVSSSVSSRFT